MKKQVKLYAVFALSAMVLTATLSSCKPDDHDHDHEHDAITKIQLVVVDSATNAPAGTFTWSDPDGIGGNNPTQIDTVKLSANKTYFTDLMVYALHDNHEDNITAEILEEKNDHLFVFKNITGNLSVAVMDKDDNNFPIGLKSRWVTGAASVGSVNIVLRHQPGVKDGTETPGDTDVDITFPVSIQ